MRMPTCVQHCWTSSPHNMRVYRITWPIAIKLIVSTHYEANGDQCAHFLMVSNLKLSGEQAVL